MSHVEKQSCSSLLDLAREAVTWDFKPNGREPGAVDCFGLFLIFAKFQGAPIPDYHYAPGWTESQNLFIENYHKYADEIDRSELRPGDVVLFRTTAKPVVNHIGTYLGHGRFIHCMKSGVSYDRLSKHPWAGRLAMCCRLKEMPS